MIPLLGWMKGHLRIKGTDGKGRNRERSTGESQRTVGTRIERKEQVAQKDICVVELDVLSDPVVDLGRVAGVVGASLVAEGS